MRSNFNAPQRLAVNINISVVSIEVSQIIMCFKQRSDAPIHRCLAAPPCVGSATQHKSSAARRRRHGTSCARELSGTAPLAIALLMLVRIDSCWFIVTLRYPGVSSDAIAYVLQVLDGIFGTWCCHQNAYGCSGARNELLLL